MPGVRVAARLIRDARRRAGLSQRELAHRAGTSQSTVSAYESGRKDPTAGTLARILAAAGATLEAAAGPENTREYLASRRPRYEPPSLADTAARIAGGEEPWFAVREFLDGVNYLAEVEHPAATGRLLAIRPPALDDGRLAALLGALAEHLAAAYAVPRPDWSIEPHRFLRRWWFPAGAPAFEALAIRDSPAAFRRRGIFILPSMLDRV